MGSLPPELSLDISPTFVPKTISDFLGEISAIRSVSERLMRLDEFLQRLEEEMRKIDAFKRELPLCMLLLNEAIVTLKEEAIRCRKRNAEPVFEEFIPLKNNSKEDEKSEAKKEKNNADKMNWMSSVQLWSTDNHKTTDSGPNQIQNSASQIIEGAVEESTLVAGDPFKSCRAGMGAFMPFKGCSIFPAMEKKKEDKEELAAAGLSFLTPKATNLKEELSFGTTGGISVSNPSPSGPSNLPTGAQLPQQQTVRKQRRCWSPELHRRFVNALNQLGGSQTATPKQIRELMQVDGLTNDEVKSHLQKYRLHTRRIPAASNTAAKKSTMSGDFWINQDNDGESSKKSNSSSGSPEGPLQLDRNIGGTSNTFGDSLEEEDEEYEKSDSYGWKNPILKSGKVHL